VICSAPRDIPKKIPCARNFLDMFLPISGDICGKAFRHMLGLDSCRGRTYRHHSTGAFLALKMDKAFMNLGSPPAMKI
jgi:hypothetical protein